ncbi:MAG: hypothetical protein ACE5MI_13425 [Acidimicrobiia bacterium]
MTDKWATARWFALGCLVGALAQLLHLWPLGFDPAATLRVGAESPALEVVLADLGTVPVAEGLGHDGQYYYLIARDPFGLKGYPELTDDGSYRFRRPLTGWLAGGFGLLPPAVTVWSLTLWQIAGMGLAASALFVLTRRLKARVWAMIGVLGCLGLWLSIQLVTADSLAMGLALWGVVAAFRLRWGWAIVAFATAALAKESYLLFALGTAGWLWSSRQRRPALAVAVIPTAAIGLWTLWLALTVGGGLSTKDNFGMPLVGFVQSIPGWLGAWDGQPVLAVGGIAAVGVAILGLAMTREPALRWLILPWLGVAAAASSVIWGGGNNAVRVFAPLWTLGFLAMATRKAVVSPELQRTSLRNLPV